MTTYRIHCLLLVVRNVMTIVGGRLLRGITSGKAPVPLLAFHLLLTLKG